MVFPYAGKKGFPATPTVLKNIERTNLRNLLSMTSLIPSAALSSLTSSSSVDSDGGGKLFSFIPKFVKFGKPTNIFTFSQSVNKLCEISRVFNFFLVLSTIN